MIMFLFGLGLGFSTGALLGVIVMCLCIARRESEDVEM